jgi:hypothetical protein
LIPKIYDFFKKTVTNAITNGGRNQYITLRGITVATAVLNGGRSLPPFQVAVGGYFLPILRSVVYFRKIVETNIYFKKFLFLQPIESLLLRTFARVIFNHF